MCARTHTHPSPLSPSPTWSRGLVSAPPWAFGSGETSSLRGTVQRRAQVAGIRAIGLAWLFVCFWAVFWANAAGISPAGPTRWAEMAASIPTAHIAGRSPLWGCRRVQLHPGTRPWLFSHEADAQGLCQDSSRSSRFLHLGTRRARPRAAPMGREMLPQWEVAKCHVSGSSPVRWASWPIGALHTETPSCKVPGPFLSLPSRHGCPWIPGCPSPASASVPLEIPGHSQANVFLPVSLLFPTCQLQATSEDQSVSEVFMDEHTNAGPSLAPGSWVCHLVASLAQPPAPHIPHSVPAAGDSPSCPCCPPQGTQWQGVY